MKRISVKLVAMLLVLLVAMVTVLSASYAWLVISSSPAANAIQVAISGGNTILIAADIAQTVDGVTYHYPDSFSDRLNFGQHDSYGYLQTLAGLRPVSTADGVNWFIPTYYTAEDERVVAGTAIAGTLRDVAEFRLDDSLTYANLTPQQETLLTGGQYVYLDFWVVSPGVDYTLHVAADNGTGSFVVDLPEVTETADGYTLSHTPSSTAASVRVGFLATDDAVTDNSMVYYERSAGYDEPYTSLRGVYADRGTPSHKFVDYQFVIYEPNADLHPTGAAQAGSYIETTPVGLVDGVPTPVSVLSNTAVQLQNRWKPAANGTDTLIEQIFQTALRGNGLPSVSAPAFYGTYLQGQFAPYIQTGAFVRRSAALLGGVSAEAMPLVDTDGTTEDIAIVELKKNIPQRLRMYIWLEGQDADWDATTAAGNFALSLELAGGTA